MLLFYNLSTSLENAFAYDEIVYISGFHEVCRSFYIYFQLACINKSVLASRVASETFTYTSTYIKDAYVTLLKHFFAYMYEIFLPRILRFMFHQTTHTFDINHFYFRESEKSSPRNIGVVAFFTDG